MIRIRWFFITLILLAASCASAQVTEGYMWEQKTCDGSVKSFTFSFKIRAATEVVVYAMDTTTTPYTSATLTSGTDYTLSVYNGRYPATGGTITTTLAYPSTTYLIITTDIALTQSGQLATGAWDPLTVQYMIDKSRAIDNEQDRRLAQTLHNPSTINPNVTTELPGLGSAGYVYRAANGVPSLKSGLTPDANLERLATNENIQDFADFEPNDAGASYPDYPAVAWLWFDYTKSWGKKLISDLGSTLLGVPTVLDGQRALDLEPGVDVQAYDPNLQAIAALNTTAHGRGLLDDANAAESRASIDAQRKLVFDVNEYGAEGDGVTGDSAAINAALAAGSGATVVFAAGTYLLDSAISVPDDVTVEFLPGAMIDLDDYNFDADNVIAGRYQIFDYTGTGVARLGTGSDYDFNFHYPDPAYPQWWGAFGDDDVDDADAIQNCLNSLGLSLAAGNTMSGRVDFGPGRFLIDHTIRINWFTTDGTAGDDFSLGGLDNLSFGGSPARWGAVNLVIQGSGARYVAGYGEDAAGGTEFEWNTTDEGPVFWVVNGRGVQFRDLAINGDSLTADTGIWLTGTTSGTRLDNLQIAECKIGVRQGCNVHWSFDPVTFSNYETAGVQAQGGMSVDMTYGTMVMMYNCTAGWSNESNQSIHTVLQLLAVNGPDTDDSYGIYLANGKMDVGELYVSEVEYGLRALGGSFTLSGRGHCEDFAPTADDAHTIKANGVGVLIVNGLDCPNDVTITDSGGYNCYAYLNGLGIAGDLTIGGAGSGSYRHSVSVDNCKVTGTLDLSTNSARLDYSQRTCNFTGELASPVTGWASCDSFSQVGCQYSSSLTDTALASDVHAGKSLYAAAGLTVANGPTSAGYVDFYDNGNNYMRQQAAASIGSNFTVTWPDAVPGSTSYLQMSTAGVLDYNTPSGAGDMEKATYDTDASGYADGNDAVPYGAGWADSNDAAPMAAVYAAILAAGGHDAVTISEELNFLLLLTGQALDFNDVAANYVLAGPTTGAAAKPTLRALVAGDIPDISGTYQTVLTNSAGLAGALSDETGSGAAVFADTPTLVTPILGTPTSGTLTNCDGTAASLTAGTATVATTVTITDNEDTAENNPLVFVAGGDLDGGDLGLESDGTTYYTPSTGVITATGFAGALTGNVTGDVSGSSGSCTGNAATATTASNLAEDGVDAITEIAAALKSGSDTTLVTGTAGSTGNLAEWDGNGDAVDSSLATADVVTGASSDTFTNKTLDADGSGNSLTNIDEDNCKDGSDLVTIGVGVVIDGGGEAISTGLYCWIQFPYNCTIKSVTLLGDQAGAIVVDIWKCSYADFDQSTHPVDGDSITSASPPTISASGVKAEDSTLTSWTTAITAGDILAFNVDSCTTIERCTLTIVVEK